MNNLRQRGAVGVFIVIGLVIIIVVGGVGFYLFSKPGTLPQLNIDSKKISTESGQMSNTPDPFNTTTTKLSDISNDFHTPIFIVSQNGRRFAYKIEKNKYSQGEKKSFVVIDGEVGKLYDLVTDPVFSPDSKRVAYIAAESGKYFIIIDDKKGSEYTGDINILELNGFSSPVFSPDSKQYAYVGNKNGRSFVVVGDKEETANYDAVQNIVFSPDSKSFAYIAKSGEKSFVVFGGKEGKQYDLVSRVIFHPNGATVSYIGINFDKTTKSFSSYLISGDEIKMIDGVSSLVYSKNGERIAYAKGLIGKESLVIKDSQGEKVGKPYNDISQIAFSPDSQHVVFRARELELSDYKYTVFLVLDGKEIRPGYYDFGKIVFSPDSLKIAYPAFQTGDNTKGTGPTHFVVVGSKKGNPYDFVTIPIFSPDSKYVGYGAMKDKELWWVVEQTN